MTVLVNLMNFKFFLEESECLCESCMVSAERYVDIFQEIKEGN